MSERIPGPIADILPDPPRMDREETYVGMLFSIWFSGLGIYLLPIGTGTVGTLEPGTQKLLAAAMLIGTTLSLFGSMLGPGAMRITAPLRWVLRRGRKHPFVPTPLRHCYRLGGAGLFSISFSLLFFSWVLIQAGSIIGTFTGLISPILFICWTVKGNRLLREARRMDKDYKRISKQVK